MGDNEDAVAILDHAISHFLGAQGMVIPTRVSSYVVPICSAQPDTPGQSIPQACIRPWLEENSNGSVRHTILTQRRIHSVCFMTR